MGKWGLPGGHIDAGETFQMTATREMHEEFGLSLNEWCDVNEYLYQGAYQKVLGTRYEGSKDLNHDTGEILDIAWYTLAEIQKMHLEKEVRTGFEVDATAKFLKSCEHLIKH
jgi:8-oxo-dGTP pyrophosphatase MutT (NUDIX family)